ncbi:hypothetical protein AVE02_21840 [Salmonella enterica subsp. enterica serovar Ago]|nr:hypothetical protein [Salmonella enterica subsp. enterica serovar Ago]
MLAALRNPGHIVIYAPGDFFPCRRDAVKTKMILHPVMPVCCVGIFDTFNDIMVTCVPYIS